MPKLDKETKERIRQLDLKSLQEIVLKLASKDKAVYHYLLINYLDKTHGEQQLFEETKADLDFITQKQFKGYSEQLRMANMLKAGMGRIKEFTATSKNKLMEAALLMHLLEPAFASGSALFGTTFTQFDYRVALIVKQLINIVTTKIHEDYKMEYADPINSYLEILHEEWYHVGIVGKLPEYLE
jgi:glutathione S-transferase